MPPTDNRILPLARVLLAHKGTGDPILTDRGFAWYDLPARSYKDATVLFDASGPTLQVREEVGLVCAPLLVHKDTRLTDYDVATEAPWDGGDWEERRTIAERSLYRLIQVDSAAGLQWAVRSKFKLPPSPHVIFSFEFIESPSDWDFAVLPPFTRIEFGEDEAEVNQWALHFSPAGNHLMRWLPLPGSVDLSPQWVSVADLPEPEASGKAENNERYVMLACQRGKIGVSVDYGYNWTYFAFSDLELPVGYGQEVGSVPMPILVPASRFTLRGQGGMVVFGLQQAYYRAGTYRSQRRNTLTPRVNPLLTFAPDFSLSRYHLPAGTNITVEDASDEAAGLAQYVATLTPASIAMPNAPWLFYTSPELYAVCFRYLPQSTFPANIYSEPWPAHIAANAAVGLIGAQISKPRELDGSRCTLKIRLDPGATFTWNSGRWPKMQVLLGELTTGGAVVWNSLWAGYVSLIDVETEEFGAVTLTIDLDNPSIRFKRATWTDFDSYPFGGLTVNTALDLILASEGLNPVFYRTWHFWGNLLTMPAGQPEDPFEFPPPGETKWETMTRIAGYANLMIFPVDDGTFATIPKQYVQPFISKILTTTPTSDLKQLVKRAHYTLDSCESATAVIVRGADLITQGPAYGYAVDKDAEMNPFSARFSPWRETVQDEMRGTPTVGMLVARAAVLAREAFPLKLESEIELPVDLTVSRRDRVMVRGLAGIGISESQQFVIEQLQHTYEADPSFARLTTIAGLRRVDIFTGRPG